MFILHLFDVCSIWRHECQNILFCICFGVLLFQFFILSYAVLLLATRIFFSFLFVSFYSTIWTFYNMYLCFVTSSIVEIYTMLVGIYDFALWQECALLNYSYIHRNPCHQKKNSMTKKIQDFENGIYSIWHSTN